MNSTTQSRQVITFFPEAHLDFDSVKLLSFLQRKIQPECNIMFPTRFRSNYWLLVKINAKIPLVLEEPNAPPGIAALRLKGLEIIKILVAEVLQWWILKKTHIEIEKEKKKKFQWKMGGFYVNLFKQEVLRIHKTWMFKVLSGNFVITLIIIFSSKITVFFFCSCHFCFLCNSGICFCLCFLTHKMKMVLVVSFELCVQKQFVYLLASLSNIPLFLTLSSAVS